MAEANPYIGKSKAELERQRELLEQAIEADSAIKHVAAATALKWAFGVLRGSGDKDNKLGEALSAINVQALPREGTLAKPAGLSETQVNEIKKAVEKALSGIKLA